ncbi:unnamed protein product [Linum trigynum]
MVGLSPQATLRFRAQVEERQALTEGQLAPTTSFFAAVSHGPTVVSTNRSRPTIESPLAAEEVETNQWALNAAAATVVDTVLGITTAARKIALTSGNDHGVWTTHVDRVRLQKGGKFGGITYEGIIMNRVLLRLFYWKFRKKEQGPPGVLRGAINGGNGVEVLEVHPNFKLWERCTGIRAAAKEQVEVSRLCWEEVTGKGARLELQQAVEIIIEAPVVATPSLLTTASATKSVVVASNTKGASCCAHDGEEYAVDGADIGGFARSIFLGLQNSGKQASDEEAACNDIRVAAKWVTSREKQIRGEFPPCLTVDCLQAHKNVNIGFNLDWCVEEAWGGYERNLEGKGMKASVENGLRDAKVLLLLDPLLSLARSRSRKEEE